MGHSITDRTYIQQHGSNVVLKHGEEDDQFVSDCGERVLPWFAIRVRSNHERVTAVHLRERGYEEFVPCFQIERRWSDRRKRLDQFLFPGYVFCRFNVEHRLPVLTTPGVVSLVGFGKTPSPIPENEIQGIRRMVDAGLLITPWPFLQVGQRVAIERGPLEGVEGILQQVKGKLRLVVSICLLQRSISAEVDRDWVRPIQEPTSKIILNQPLAGISIRARR